MAESKPHVPSEDCWCKPKVTRVGNSAQTIEHRTPKEVAK